MRNVKQIRIDTVENNHYEFTIQSHVKRVNEIVDEAAKWFQKKDTGINT